MQLKDPRGDSCCSNEKLEYDKSTLEEKMGHAKAVAGVCLPESNQIASENIGQYYWKGNFKLFSECKIKNMRKHLSNARIRY